MKKLLAAVICAVMVFTMAVPAMANDGTTTMYTTVTTVMYAGPSYESGIVRSNIPAGADIICYQKEYNGFENCFYDVSAGWIPLANLSTVKNGNNGGGSQNNLSGNYYTTMYTSQTVNLRQGPSTNYPILTSVPAGDPIFVYTVTDGWVECDYGLNYHGFVSTAYIQGWNTPQDYPANATTWANGYDWSKVYNFGDYMRLNPDVAAVYGNNPTGALTHFVTYGIYEGRQASSTWNLQTYKAQNPALVTALGNNNAAYYKVACGIPLQ